MQPKVSVIVAVYNIAPFLDKCLTSLKAQTLKDFEVILVDDGSTDNSGKMCDAYAQEDNRFKIFHKANGGVASAREFGVGKASGLSMLYLQESLSKNLENCSIHQVLRGYSGYLYNIIG